MNQTRKDEEESDMTKIDIISGFLGAGKTTFIKKMLEDVFQGEKIVLIENEFGEIGIDGGFLKDSGIEISELNSGCICCSLVGDFGRNLREVMERFHPDRILIEPSGVGKLSDVMKSVQEVEAENEVKLNGRITVVNTPKATKQMKSFGEFFNNQIEYATVVVLSRTQNVKPEQTELVADEIRKKNPKALISSKVLSRATKVIACLPAMSIIIIAMAPLFCQSLMMSMTKLPLTLSKSSSPTRKLSLFTLARFCLAVAISTVLPNKSLNHNLA